MSKQKARYIGPDGNVNHDVARETRAGAKMRTGEVYEVSEDLFKGLMLSADWEPETGSKTLARTTLEEAQKASDALSKAVPEGMSYEDLVASQEAHVKAEEVEAPAPPPANNPADPDSRERANNGGGEDK